MPRARGDTLFREVFDQAGIGMVVLDLSGTIARCNDAFCRMVGHEEAMLAGMAWTRFAHDSDREDLVPVMGELLSGRRDRVRIERRAIRSDGESIFVRATISLVRDAVGRPECAVALVEDVTERRRAEDALRESEGRQRLLLQQMPAVLWSTDRDLRFTSSTGSGLAALGLRHGEVVGQSLFEFFRTDDRGFPPIDAHVRALAGERVAYDMTWDQRVYRSYVEPLHDEAGRIVGTVGLAIDATDQARSDEALRHADETLRSVTESAPDYVMMLDLEGRILFINRTMPGVSLDNVIGTTVFDHFPARSHAGMRAAFERVARTGQPDRYEVEYDAPNGKVLSFSSRVQPVRRGGEIVHLTVYATDVSVQRALESQLHHAQRMESIGRLAGGIAHDFNNQLSVVMGSAELARRNAGSPAAVAAELARILAAGERAAALTRQLLAFSRKQVLNPRLVHLNTLVAGVQEMLRRVIGEDVRLRLDLGRVGPVRVDPGQLEQVILNLAINARDAMPAGGQLSLVTSETSLPPGRAALPPGRYAQLAVIDTGIGMDAATLARLFEPFFTTKEVGKGTGLGLAVAHGIVTQSGGHIEAESAPGAGSTFRILLPIADGRAEEAPGDVPAGSRGSETVLVVEDERMVLEVTRRVLEERGYRVLAAGGGAEALALLEREGGDVHLLLTDVVMPGMDGVALARRARELRPGLRVILVSGYAPDIVRGAEAARHPFLQKPVPAGVLAHKVREVLDGRSAAVT